MMKQMKKTSLILLLLFSVSLLAACKSDSKKEEPVAVDIKTLADRLQKEVTYTDTLSAMEEDLFSYLYTDVAAEDVSDKAVYLSSGSTAEEIAVFEAVDEEAAKRIQTGLEERLTMQKEGFENYVPEEVKRLDDAIIKVSGKYVVLSISGDPSTANDIINSVLETN